MVARAGKRPALATQPAWAPRQALTVLAAVPVRRGAFDTHPRFWYTAAAEGVSWLKRLLTRGAAVPGPGVLPFRTVAIVGVGLIGGSLGLALRAGKLARRVIGVCRRQAALERAVALGAVDEGTLDLAAGVAEAELTVLATHVGAMPLLAQGAVAAMPRGSLMTDVGSTKGRLVRALAQAAGTRVRYVGSHPMAGSEKRGVEEAVQGLFQGATCFVTPTAQSDPLAVNAVSDLWRALGGRVRLIDPDEHDRLVAVASHLPHLVAAALVNVATPEAIACAGSGFRDTTRVASGDPRMWTDVCLENRRRVLEALDCFEREMATLHRILAAGSESELLAWLESAKAVRDNHLHP